MRAMKPQVDILVNNAKVGVAPDAMAQTVVDLTPKDKLNDLYEFIGADNCIERLTALNPEVQNYLPFFEQLRNRVKYLLIPEGDATTVPESEDFHATGAETEGVKTDAIREDPGAVTGDS